MKKQSEIYACERMIESLEMVKKQLWMFLHFAEHYNTKEDIIKLWHEFEDINIKQLEKYKKKLDSYGN